MNLDRNLINFVEEIDARDVCSVALDDVDEIVGGGVVSQRDVGIVDLVLRQNRLNLRLITFFTRKFDFIPIKCSHS